MNQPITHTIGIDIAKDTFCVRLLLLGGTPTPVGEVKSFSNSRDGYEQMKRWIVEQGAEPAYKFKIVKKSL